MVDDETLEELVAARDQWIEEYGIKWGEETKGRFFILDEMTEKEKALLEKLDKKKLVWTNHSTCEDEYFTAGYHNFNNSCCWQTYSYYVAEKPWEDEYDRVNSTAFMPCPKCNADAEGEGDPDCEGPELPETKYGVELSDGCDEGFIQIYLD